MCLNIIHVNDYISHFSNGSTVPHFYLNLRPYDTTQVMYYANQTETLENEIQEKTEQLENVIIADCELTPGYIREIILTVISSGK